MGDKGNITPISRNNLFYSAEDFEFETDLIDGYLEEDLNQTVVVYEVDRKRTNVNDIYKEAKKDTIRFLPPKEIPCMFEIQDAQLNAFDSKSSTGTYQISGNLTVYVTTNALEKYKCDIKRGDYLAIQIDEHRMSYFTVTDDGKVNNANKLMVGGYKPSYWRIINAAPAQEFRGK
jgi:hypothetical protein